MKYIISVSESAAFLYALFLVI